MCMEWLPQFVGKTIIFKETAIVYVKGNSYRIYFWDVSKDKVVSLIRKADLYGNKKYINGW